MLLPPLLTQSPPPGIPFYSPPPPKSAPNQPTLESPTQTPPSYKAHTDHFQNIISISSQHPWKQLSMVFT